MKNYRQFPAWLAAASCLACLGFTGSVVAWADPARASYVEDPLAPHQTTGTTARLGSSVGFLHGEPVEALALGVVAAAGRRWGRLALEAEYGYFELSEKGPSDRTLGEAQRLGVITRLDVIRLGSEIVGGNSMLAIYVEGGAAVAWNNWNKPALTELSRLVPHDTKRVEGQLGFGMMLDHRLQEPIGFPRRIGWFLGWRMAMSPHDSTPASICRGVSCRSVEMTSEDRFVDRAMLFQSSMSVTW